MGNINQVYAQLKQLAPNQLTQIAQNPEHGVASLLAAARLNEAQAMQPAQPAQPGTVVQRLLAQMQQPQQPQAPQMPAQPPVQKFADGGSVTQRFFLGTSDSPLSLKPWWWDMPVVEKGRKLLAGEKPARPEPGYDERVKAIPPTTWAQHGLQPPGTAVAGVSEQAPPQPMPPESKEKADLRAALERAASGMGGGAGISAVGYNPPKFEGQMPTRRDPRTFNVDAMPTNEELAALAAEYRQPDAKRMAELEQARKNAGLAMFAQQVMKGRGLGGAFGPAAGSAVQAMAVEDEKRREYEDRRKALSDQLRLKTGEEKRANVLAGREEQRRLSDQDYSDRNAELQFGYKVNRDQADDAYRGADIGLKNNSLKLEERKLRAYLESNSLEAKMQLAQLKAEKGIDPKTVLTAVKDMMEREPGLKADVAFNRVMAMYSAAYTGIAGLRAGQGKSNSAGLIDLP